MKYCKTNSTLLLSILILLQSCCAIEEPEFDLNQLPDAVLNQQYSQIITAHIKNNPNDDSFNYSFSISDGLPAGMSIYVIPNNRRVIIEGTPIEYGDFNFILTVKTEEKEINQTSDHSADDFFVDLAAEITEDAICSIGSNEHSQTYTLSVSIM